MSISIHHGSNGSYKTAGVINDFLIPAARAGRVVVTNIRGVSRERTMMHMDDVPDSFDVHFIDTDTREGRYKIATWFHWVPLGALLLFDESGVMFPKAWRQKDLDALDYPGGTDAASTDGRPANWVEAWEMHRHFNWDIVLTAPNIKSIRDDIRQTTEGAYKHKNKALLGPMFSGYKEGYHDAQKNGQSASDFDVIRDKRVNPLAFRLYDSTKTGKAQQTLNGFNLFKSPRVVLSLGIAFASIGYSLYSGILDVFSSPLGASPASALESAAVPIPDSTPQASSSLPESRPDPVPDTRVRYVDPGPDRKAGILETGPLAGSRLWISGYLQTPHRIHYVFSVLVEGDPIEYVTADLQQMGYHIYPRGRCSAEIGFRSERYPMSCVRLIPYQDDSNSMMPYQAAGREGREVDRPNDSQPVQASTRFM